MKLLIKVIDAKMHVLVFIRNEAGKVLLAEWKSVQILACLQGLKQIEQYPHSTVTGDPRVRLCCGAV